MKYSSILAALLSLAPSSLADKPDHECMTTTTKEPRYNLGGYDVLLDDYGGFSTANGLLMVEALWRKDLTSEHTATITPAKEFDPDTLAGLGGDDYFAFDDDGPHWRGVGVMGGDTEISDNEGMYITFGGLTTKEVAFGVRAFQIEWEGTVMETGLVKLYKDDLPIASNFELNFTASDDGSDGDDGQEYYYLVSDVEFDAMSFITYSHDMFWPDNEYGNHDYFVEYLDICKDVINATMNGDPHVQTWSGEKFDFHGVCDLVLLQNPDFHNGLGMDIHVRTKQVKEFSYISSAVLRIGDETLEIEGDLYENLYWINGEFNGNLDNGISGYSISSRKVNSKQYEFIVHLDGEESIMFKTWKKFVRVNIQGATKETFGTSLGMLGTFGSGKMMARDRTTVIEDVNAFGMEWQVLPSEDMLFHNAEGPQAPEKCYIPVATNLRRRLAETNISEKEAEAACAGVNGDDFDLCVFDVMATGDLDLAGAY